MEDLYDAEAGVLDLRDCSGRVELRVSCEDLPQELVDRVFPAAERAAPPIRVSLAAVDDAGWHRSAHVLGRVDDQFVGVVDIDPCDATGDVELRAVVVRTTDASESEGVEGFASRCGMRVASSGPLCLRTREPRTTPGGALDVRWEDFGASTHPLRRRRSDRVFYIETTNEPPVLWLNSSNPDLVAVLNSKGTRGPKAMVRDLISRAVAMPAWYALIHTASLSVTYDEDGKPFAREGWRAGMLARIAPHMHPGLRKEQAYQRLLEDLLEQREEGAPTNDELPERLALAVQDEVSFADVTRRALRELASR